MTESTPAARIGYWLSEKKQCKLNFPAFKELAERLANWLP